MRSGGWLVLIVLQTNYENKRINKTTGRVKG